MGHIVQYLFITTVLLGVTYGSHFPKCKAIQSTIGYTYPQGDIIIERGSTLNITCTINRTLYSDERLVFRRNKSVLDDDLVTKISDRSIQLIIENAPATKDDMYSCFLTGKNKEKGSLICLNSVTVGVAPSNVTDFQCIGYNFDNFTCTWTAPMTYVPSQESISMKFNSFIYNTSIQKNGTKRSIFLSSSTQPYYRLGYENYSFKLNMSNEFGSWNQNFTIDHFARVIPNPPVRLTVLSVTTTSIMMNWSIPETMRNLECGIHHRVLYQCDFAPTSWTFGTLITTNPKEHWKTFNLTGIPYPHSMCDVRVSLRSAAADPNDESMWSRNASFTQRTASTLPREPPATNVGGFDMSGSDFYMYWGSVKDAYRNGDKFNYVVTSPEVSINHTTTKHYFHSKNLSSDRSYTFYIWSQNSDGFSKNNSTLYIPKLKDRVKKPTDFTKSELNDGRYKLKWKRPVLAPGQELISYTIFWCKDERDRPYQCTGDLQWKMIPPTNEAYEITLESSKIYQMAISANTWNSSSGMVWADCTVLSTGRPKLTGIYFDRLGDTWMGVKWLWGCGSLNDGNETYVIEYCPIKSPMLQECKEPENETLKHMVFNNTHTSAQLVNLMPYTTYKVNVYLQSGDEKLLQNEMPLYNTTLEAAPKFSPYVKVLEVTNSSISINWTEPDPLTTNGKLKYYHVSLNNKTVDVQSSVTSFNFTNLESYKNFSIAVSACTVQCSTVSRYVNVITEMGIPGDIEDKPVMTFQNHSYTSIIWGEPIPPRGKNEYYEVKLKKKADDYENIVNVTSRQYNFSNCQDYDAYLVSVRAVNIINNTAVKGPWSKPLETYCQVKGNYFIYIIIVVIVFALFSMLYLVRWGYVKIIVMKNVEVKLPPGLAPVVQNDLVPWQSGKHPEEHTRFPPKPADEEMLLSKIKENTPISADTSGCSSAHESVTSSLESAHISSADSGTDQKDNEEAAQNSLRKRNFPTKASSGYVLPENATGWAAKPAVSSSSYCKVGEPLPKKEESPYVPLDKAMEVKTSPIGSTPSTPLISSDLMMKNLLTMPEVQPSPKSGYVVTTMGAPKDVVADLMSNTTPTEEMQMPHYVQAADAISSMKNFAWPHAPETPKTGYVSVGDAPPPTKVPLEQTRGYVPHRHFEGKSFKKD